MTSVVPGSVVLAEVDVGTAWVTRNRSPDEETVDTTTVVSYELRGEPVTSTRKVHSVKVRLIPRAVLFALAAVGFVLLALGSRLPRWLRGESSMPYAVSRIAGASLVALGIGSLAVVLAGTKGVRPFTTSVETLIPVAVVAVAWAMLVLYWWRWREGAGRPNIVVDGEMTTR